MAQREAELGSISGELVQRQQPSTCDVVLQERNDPLQVLRFSNVFGEVHPTSARNDLSTFDVSDDCADG